MKRLRVPLFGLKLAVVLLWTSFASGASAVIPWGPMSEVEAAARKEGKLVIYAGPGHISPEAQRAISDFFNQKYRIMIDWTSMSARDIAPRVMAEQRTKQYVADIAMSGIEGNYTVLKPKGYVVPILAPSTLEKGVWRLDPATATPEDRDWLFINMPLRPSFFINNNLVRPGEEPKSYQDLLLPKWKGKIALQTPWTGGTGSGWFRATYKKLGLDYMRALAKQVVLVPNVNDSVDTVVRGQYPIGIASSPERGRKLVLEGAPVRYVQPKEGAHMAVQGIQLITNAPHPNAAKLYLHWFYTKEGQSIYAPKTLAISVRKDTPQDYLIPEERYMEGQPFLMPDPEDFTLKRNEELPKLARQIFEEAR
jgi:iron(III) transport system substrate-binding protein